MIAEAENEVPIGICIEPANTNDKKLFEKLFRFVRNAFTFNYKAKYLADSAYDSIVIKEELRRFSINPCNI
jgi:hypothetical protein